MYKKSFLVGVAAFLLITSGFLAVFLNTVQSYPSECHYGNAYVGNLFVTEMDATEVDETLGDLVEGGVEASNDWIVYTHAANRGEYKVDLFCG